MSCLIFIVICMISLTHAAEWLLLLSQNINSGGYFPRSFVHSTNFQTTNYNPTDPSNPMFSIIGSAGTIASQFLNSAGKYQLRLVYNDGNADLYGNVAFDAIWSQSNWITQYTVSGSDYNYFPFNGATHSTCTNMFGLGLSTSGGALLDGEGSMCSWWFHAVGSWTRWHTGIPVDHINGVPVAAYQVDLYICTGDGCSYSSPIEQCGASGSTLINCAITTSICSDYALIDDGVDRTRAQAEAECNARGFDGLATIRTDAQKTCAASLLSSDAWIDLKSSGNDQPYTYGQPCGSVGVDVSCPADEAGSCVANAWWKEGKPHRCKTESQCVGMNVTGLLNNEVDCTDTRPAVLCNNNFCANNGGVSAKEVSSNLLDEIMPDTVMKGVDGTKEITTFMVYGAVIAFILINNVFLCYWCVCKRGYNGYQLADVVLDVEDK